MPVSRLANGLELSLPLHILKGKQDGPTLMLTAVSHGDATTGFEAIRQIMETVDLDKLCGTIIAIRCRILWPLNGTGETRLWTAIT